MIKSIILFLFVSCMIIQLIYWGIIFFRFLLYQPKNEHKIQNPPAISVIICAYNEEENLKKNLPLILEQNYSNYEVLIVNDDSTDATKEILNTFKKEYSHLNILNISYHKKRKLGKKNALSQGIKASLYDTILVTDADCYPKSKNWISYMANSLNHPIEIGLGYGPYKKENTFVNYFIRYETVYTAIQYMSLALWGLAYMGVGRNMIYKKSLFYKANGFDKHSHIPSGDDDLFINEVSNQKNTSIIIHPETFMFSSPKKTWKEYLHQKRRHITTGKHYKWVHQIVLGLFSFTHFGMYFFALLLCLYGISMIFVILFIITISLKNTIFGLIALKLKEQNLIPLIFVLDIIYILYYIVLAPTLMWGKTIKWK